MKIEGPRRTESKTTSKTSKTKSSGGASFSKHLSGSSSGEDSLSELSGGVGGVMGIDALLSVQGAGDATEGGSGNRSRMLSRAASILDDLEEIRMGLLLGELTVGQLENLAKRVETQRENLDNPELLELLDEIDMRAQIELAKFGR